MFSVLYVCSIIASGEPDDGFWVLNDSGGQLVLIRNGTRFTVDSGDRQLFNQWHDGYLLIRSIEGREPFTLYEQDHIKPGTVWCTYHETLNLLAVCNASDKDASIRRGHFLETKFWSVGPNEVLYLFNCNIDEEEIMVLNSEDGPIFFMSQKAENRYNRMKREVAWIETLRQPWERSHFPRSDRID